MSAPVKRVQDDTPHLVGTLEASFASLREPLAFLDEAEWSLRPAAPAGATQVLAHFVTPQWWTP